ncbi:MAG: hypothetical protein D6B25_02485 [Desulfobulbaceae bacterium]|nr:MAG: hypothetical protein D6B25_02485 [Desulfobulbaceae bacterium]
MLKPKVTVLVITILLHCLALNGWAKEISVGVSTGYPPYYYEQDGTLQGICIDIVNTVAETLGYEVTYRQFPWKRLLAEARKGSVDAIMPLFRTTEREAYLLFDGLNLAYETNHLFAHKNQDIEFSGDLSTLRSYSIGVVSDYSYGKDFDSLTDLNKVVTQSDKHLLDMFAFHRFQVGIGSKYVILYFAQQAGIDKDIQFLSPAITRDKLYLAFTRKSEQEDLAATFAQALQDFLNSKPYQAIMEKYGLQD